MSKHTKFLLVATTALTLLACQPETKTARAVTIELPTELSENYKTAFSRNPERTAKSFLSAFDRMAENGPVTEERITHYMRIRDAKIRATFISELLSLDLNGDGEVTDEEIDITEAITRRAYSRSRLSRHATILELDINGNGRVSLKEMISYFDENSEQYNIYRESSPESHFHLFDLDEDGITTRAEILESFEAFYTEESANLPQTKNMPKLRPSQNITPRKKTERSVAIEKPELTHNCTLPPVEKSAEIISVSGYEADLFSDVAVGGYNTATYTAHLTIEEGKKPIYIIATTYQPMLWVVDGATERVKSFVAQPARSKDSAGVAVAGLPEKHISFIHASCFPRSYKPTSKEAVLFKGKVNAQLGQEPTHIIGQYKFQHHAIPSGTLLTPSKPISRNSNTEDLWSHKKYSINNNVVSVPIKDIVAPRPVEKYKVLPGHAGLQQLVASGHLKKLEGRSYHIVKPIAHFPARLTGAHSVDFILGKGLDIPDGSPGHSKVYSEDTGEIIKGPFKR